MSFPTFRAALLAATAALPATLTAQEAAPPATPAVQDATDGWGRPLSDLPADPAVRFGTLANGMKYAIRHNEFPTEGAAVRMHVDFGGFEEADDELGLAHFIEHMAFNGTTNVAEGDMIKLLERQGLAFGADTNASTGYDQTIYKLDLPKADAERLDTALFLMRETASEILFDEGAVERERGVILAERRTRMGWQRDLSDARSKFLYPDSLFTRPLIGTEEVLKTAPAARMEALYDRYYRPENTTLVVVGNIDVDAVEAQIAETFADWQGTGQAGPDADVGDIDFDRPAAIDQFIHPAASNSIGYAIFRPYVDTPDTLAERRRQIVESFGTAIFNTRLRRAVQREGSVLTSASMGSGDVEDIAAVTSIGAAGSEGSWPEAVDLIDTSLRQALEYGFTRRELDRAIANQQGSYDRSVARQNARSHAALAGAILSSLSNETVITTPDTRRDLFESIAADVTVEEVEAAFRDLWQGSEPQIFLTGRSEVDETAVAARFEKSGQTAVAMLEEDELSTFAYEDFGTPSAIVADDTIEDLGIRTIAFDNGVRLNIKTTDFEEGRVAFAVRLGRGLLMLGQDATTLGTYWTRTNPLAATGEHSLEELRELMAGRQVRLGYEMSEEAIRFSGTIGPDDLLLQMQAAAAYVTDPGNRPEAQQQWANTVPLIEEQIRSTPGGVLAFRFMEELTGDPRAEFPSADALLAVTQADAYARVAPLLDEAPIEIGIVGDVDADEAIAAVAQTFGAFEARTFTPQPDVPTFAIQRGRAPIVLDHDGPADQTLTGIVWPTDDNADQQQAVGLSLLRAVMDLRLTEEVREALGDSYSVSVSDSQSRVHDGFGTFFVRSIVAPGRADAVDETIRAVAKELRDAPVSEDLLTRARQPMLERRERSVKRNGYWLGYVEEAQSRPGDLDRQRAGLGLIEAVTPEQLQALAQRFLTDDQAIPVRVSSTKSADAESGDEGADPAL